MIGYENDTLTATSTLHSWTYWVTTYPERASAIPEPKPRRIHRLDWSCRIGRWSERGKLRLGAYPPVRSKALDAAEQVRGIEELRRGRPVDQMPHHPLLNRKRAILTMYRRRRDER